MARRIVFVGLACSVCLHALRRDDADRAGLDSNEGVEEELGGMDRKRSDDHELASAGDEESVELEEERPHEYELRLFQLLKDLRKKGFTCPNGRSFPGIRDTEKIAQYDCRLHRAARKWSMKMATDNFYGHYDGKTPGNWATRAAAEGYWGENGENLMAGSPTPEDVMKAFKKSTLHCVAMMNASNKDFGNGYVRLPGRNSVPKWTMMFGANDQDPATKHQSCLKGARAPKTGARAPKPTFAPTGPPTVAPPRKSRRRRRRPTRPPTVAPTSKPTRRRLWRWWGGSTHVGSASGDGTDSGGNGGGSSGSGDHKANSNCFPPSAKVLLDPGAGYLGIERALSELSPGDKLLGQHDEPNTYLLDFHADVKGREFKPTSFLRIEHELQKADRPLIITANHLVVASTLPDGRQVSVPAGLLHPEKHALLVSVGADGERGAKVLPSLIKSVDVVVLPGFAAPLTSSGTLFVEGVVVSSYALLSDKQLALWQRGPSFLRDNTQLICHIVAMPFRWASIAGYGSKYLSILSGVFDCLSSSLVQFSSNAASVSLL
eukprot:TRINITY_DN5696_c0_g1_i1.p1 TRINITY_DN5696_c0_g1~~TRINITY_DN5696_c0_g1_i1.p1  ORF type:complete len:561 (-),score=71.57 TRINITY_DN5696_c0_g1_i1:242-1882(-)